MSTVIALAAAGRAAEPHEMDSFEELVLVCLDTLAAQANLAGQRRRAGRLQEAAAVLRGGADPSSAAELSHRQWEVAALVARGYSNRQIARELIVSERTVDTHVSHILRRLELATRAQIAAWVVQRQPRFKVLA